MNNHANLALLDELDELFENPSDDNSSNLQARSEGNDSTPDQKSASNILARRMVLINDWVEKLAERTKIYGAADYKMRRKRDAKEHRDHYAAVKLATAGQKVRSYQKHEYSEAPEGETCAELAVRCQRERQRHYRGKNNESVRQYTDLSNLTEDELRKHNRNRQNVRKQAQRLREQGWPEAEAKQNAQEIVAARNASK